MIYLNNNVAKTPWEEGYVSNEYILLLLYSTHKHSKNAMKTMKRVKRKKGLKKKMPEPSHSQELKQIEH